MSVTFLDEEWSWKSVTLETLVNEGNIPIEWSEFFSKPEIQEEIVKISKGIEESEIEVYPPPNRVFRVFSVPPEKIRVVILGQDPYHDGNAVGLCFSVPSNKTINPSLRNIYTELEHEGFKPIKNGDLSSWADQGCFLLNTALTVQKSCPDSHTGLWSTFTDILIEYIASRCESVAWILWGKSAYSFKNRIGNRGKIFASTHPSPFSANKSTRELDSFIGSGIFRNVNLFLEKTGREKIIW